MSCPSTVPFPENPGFHRHLLMLVTALLRFLAPAFYCRSWAPWGRLIITVTVVVIVVLIFRSSGAPVYTPMM